jgi:hypothetical protein
MCHPSLMFQSFDSTVIVFLGSHSIPCADCIETLRPETISAGSSIPSGQRQIEYSFTARGNE